MRRFLRGPSQFSKFCVHIGLACLVLSALSANADYPDDINSNDLVEAHEVTPTFEQEKPGGPSTNDRYDTGQLQPPDLDVPKAKTLEIVTSFSDKDYSKYTEDQLYKMCSSNNKKSCKHLQGTQLFHCFEDVHVGCQSAVKSACIGYAQSVVGSAPAYCGEGGSGPNPYADITGRSESLDDTIVPPIPADPIDRRRPIVTGKPVANCGGPGKPCTPADCGNGPGQPACPTCGVPGKDPCEAGCGGPGQTTCPTESEVATAQQEDGAADALVQACMDSFSEANTCCKSPMSCLGVDQSTQQGLASGAGMGGQAVGGMLNSGDSASMQQACGIMKNTGYSAAGLNAAGASMCNQNKNSCVDTCQAGRDAVRKMIISSCGYDPSAGRGGSCSLQSKYDTLISRQTSCTTFNANIAAMGQQASHSYSSAQMSAKCEQMASNTNPSGMPDIAGMLGGLQNQGNSTVDCSDSRFKDTVACKGSAGGNYDSGDGSSDPLKGPDTPVGSTGNFGTRPDSFNTSEVGGEQNQQGPSGFDGPLGATTMASKGVPNGGGGFTGGGSSGGGGGGARGKSGSGGSGYNTDVLHGYSGGSGYSNPVGQNNRGAKPQGGNQFGSLGGGGNAKAQPNFDLKQFLPGGKSDPGRKIAGMARAVSSEIGPSHSNIWNTVSNKMRELCNLNILYDCGRGK